MRKILILILLLLTFAVWSQAQDAGNTNGKTSGKTSGLTTMEGCLQSSNSQYTLTDDTNTSHILTGAVRKLSPQVGHQVEVTGKPGMRTIDNTLVGGASSVIEQPIFEVKSVKLIAATCK